MKYFTFIFFIFILTFNCFSQEIKHYFFVGHPYSFVEEDGLIDRRLVALDLKNNYDRIWLGGDVLAKSTYIKNDVAEVVDLFDLHNSKNHWVMGNHDAWGENWEWYRQLCNNKTYYAYNQDKITSIVLNTNITPIDCEKLDEQYHLIENVCDTIEDSKYLILLFHHGIFRNIPGLDNYVPNVDKKYWDTNCKYVDNRQFSNSIYPLLVEVQEKNIQVICIVGDLGSYSKSFYDASDDGIVFLGNGIWNSIYFNNPEVLATKPKDKVLIFEHNIDTQELNWNFYDLDSLVNSR